MRVKVVTLLLILLAVSSLFGCATTVMNSQLQQSLDPEGKLIGSITLLPVVVVVPNNLSVIGNWQGNIASLGGKISGTIKLDIQSIASTITQGQFLGQMQTSVHFPNMADGLQPVYVLTSDAISDSNKLGSHIRLVLKLVNSDTLKGQFKSFRASRFKLNLKTVTLHKQSLRQ